MFSLRGELAKGTLMSVCWNGYQARPTCRAAEQAAKTTNQIIRGRDHRTKAIQIISTVTPPIDSAGLSIQILNTSIADVSFYSTINNATARGSSKICPNGSARICELHSIGWGYKRIRKKHSHISLSTIRYANK